MDFNSIHRIVSAGILAALVTTNALKESSDREEPNLSHTPRDTSLEAATGRIRTKIIARGDLPNISVEKQLELVDQLNEFDLGRFLLQTGGLNGYWTHYLILHPHKGRLTGINDAGVPFGSLESFILNKAPLALATQQRSEIFKEQLQKRVLQCKSIASIPCGLMADLLELDFSEHPSVRLTGVDIDPLAIDQAKLCAKEKGLLDNCIFASKDAWSLNIHEEFDLLTSNGLSIYEPDDKRVISLYRQFFSALKKGGWLITSFITPPPGSNKECPWDMTKINAQDAGLQKALFVDVLETKWQSFRTEETVIQQLRLAGFEEIEVIYDEARMFPTVIAKKPN